MILCYGSINPDLVHRVDRVPAVGDDVPSRGFEVTFGGGAANVAVCLAAWGAQVGLAGNTLGTDPLADFIKYDLGRRGVDTSLVRQHADSETPHTVVLVTPDGERTIVGSDYRGVAWLDPERRLLSTCEAVLVDGYSGAAGVRVAAKSSAEGVVVVGLDVGRKALGSCRLVVWSRHEHDVDEAEAAALGGTVVLLTSGPDPVTVLGSGKAWRVMPPAVRAGDALGAGDAFGAACALGVASQWPLEETVRRATAAGALVAAARRGDPPPPLEEVIRLGGTLLTARGSG